MRLRPKEIDDNILISLNHFRREKMEKQAILTAYAVNEGEEGDSGNKIGKCFTTHEFAHLLVRGLGGHVWEFAQLVEGPTGLPAVLYEHATFGIDVEDLTLDTAGEFVDQIEDAVRGYDLDEPISEFADFLKQCIIFTVGKSKSLVGLTYTLVGEVEVEENDN